MAGHFPHVTSPTLLQQVEFVSLPERAITERMYPIVNSSMPMQEVQQYAAYGNGEVINGSKAAYMGGNVHFQPALNEQQQQREYAGPDYTNQGRNPGSQPQQQQYIYSGPDGVTYPCLPGSMQPQPQHMPQQHQPLQPMTTEQLRAQLKRQLEYYFSPENLSIDSYLISQMDAEQYVPISIIARFNKVKNLTDSLELIIDVLKGLCVFALCCVCRPTEFFALSVCLCL
jgi:hypothetical protein